MKRALLIGFPMLINMPLELMREGVLLSLKMGKLPHTTDMELGILLIVTGHFKDIRL